MQLSSESESETGSATTGLADFFSAARSLTVVCAVTALVIAGFGYAFSGAAGIWAALVAAVISWIAATISLMMATAVKGTTLAAGGILLGSPIRMGMTLGACLFFIRRGGPLMDAGIVFMILVNYLVTLMTDTCLLLRDPAVGTGIKRVSRAS